MNLFSHSFTLPNSRPLKTSAMEGLVSGHDRGRADKPFVFVITRRPSGRREICFSTFLAASKAAMILLCVGRREGRPPQIVFHE